MRKNEHSTGGRLTKWLMNLAKNSIPDDPHSCYNFLVNKDNVWVFVEDEKAILNLFFSFKRNSKIHRHMK